VGKCGEIWGNVGDYGYGEGAVVLRPVQGPKLDWGRLMSPIGAKVRPVARNLGLVPRCGSLERAWHESLGFGSPRQKSKSAPR
jgi:hypothetical protein